MSSLPKNQTTGIAFSTAEDVFVRGKSLTKELIGRLTFTEMIVFQILGRMPSPGETRVIDACLVALMEHGLTPSALATRLVYSSATEAMQAAVAAGLLAVGSRFVGTTDDCGQLLERMLAAGGDLDDQARVIAREHQGGQRAVPGFGHPLHKPDDPRARRLLEIARDEGVAGAHVAAVLALSRAIDEVYGKHITLNVTGAIAALLGDCGVPREILRGFSIIARAAGLVGHVHEEQRKPAMRAIWETADQAIPYDGVLPGGGHPKK
jgi:citrate synthase